MRKLFFALLFILFLISCGKEKNDKNLSEKQNKDTALIKTVHILSIIDTESDHSIITDEIEFLTGEDASKFYKLDKNKDLDEATFYMRNLSADSVIYRVSNSVIIETQTLNLPKEKFHYFAEMFNSNEYISNLPFEISLSKDTIIKIKEIYIP